MDGRRDDRQILSVRARATGAFEAPERIRSLAWDRHSRERGNPARRRC